MPHSTGGFPCPPNPAPPMTMAPMPVAPQMAMTPMGAMPMGVAPAVAPACPPAAHSVTVVGDKVKPDEWTEYTDDDSGKKYYHNPAKKETTWEKPEDFDKMKNAGKPAPPSGKPKNDKPKYVKK